MQRIATGDLHHVETCARDDKTEPHARGVNVKARFQPAT
jgi:hypothetical protein